MMLSIPRGTRDFLPEQMLRRQYVINIVKNIFEKYGFDPLETPSIEFKETLTGKYGEEEKLIWEFEDLGGRKVALRYDLTVPLSRVVASNPQLPKPFKRYQIQLAWRYDEPQKGRYREFYQCDVDIIGSSNMAADAEIITIIIEIMNALKFEEFKVRINNRKILNRITEWSGLATEKAKSALSAIDKFDKVGLDGVKKELAERGIEKKAAERLLEAISIDGKPKQVLDKIEKLVGKNPGIDELREILKYLELAKVSDDYYAIDLSIARGLDYYTGPVWETRVTKPKIGSLAGGGRFDKLISKLSDGAADLPGTGTTIGLERIVDAMTELEMFDSRKTTAQVYVAAVNEEVAEKAFEIAQELRKSGINVRTDLMNRKLGKQFEYASSLGIPFVVIVGPDELKLGKVKLRDMNTGKEELLALKDLRNKII